MKFLLIIVSLLLCDIANATNYYVSTSGSDSNPGTILQPFKTVSKLSTVLVAGDIAYLRGGTYRSSGGNNAGVHFLIQNLTGTALNPITIQSYPGEVPIFNCDNIITTQSYPWVMIIQNSPFLRLKGKMVITGLKQISNGSGVSRGLLIDNCNNAIIENIESSYNGGPGFILQSSNDVLYLNCDANHNDDRLSIGYNWGGTDGFACSGGDGSTRTTFTGCRSWLNSDDGWDNFQTNGIRTWNNCWSFLNGYYQDPGMPNPLPAGDGMGFKLGPAGVESNTMLRFMNNCLAFYNGDHGFDQNGTPTMRYQIYNCVSFKNGGNGFEFGYFDIAPGFTQTFKNNISYQNGNYPLRYCGSNANNTNNTWTGGGTSGNSVCGWTGGGLVTLNNADFLSLDTTGVTGARGSNGELPVLNFLHLAASSDLIDAGINVGLPFTGAAPDMGAFEYSSSSNIPPTANANTDKTITLPVNTVTLSGGGTDPDGTISSYSWVKISGPTSGTITNTTAATTTVTSLVQGIYQFELTVTDNNGATDTDIMQVTVNPVANQVPTANAGLDQNITLPVNAISLNGSGTDPDGTISAYLWTKISGPAGGTITNTTSATTTVTALTQGVYRFVLRVTDNSSATDTDTMQVTVNPAVNQVPTANAGLDQNITLPVNAVSLNGSGTDPDGTISAYLWTKISGPAGGTITNTTSATTTVTALTQGVYRFVLRVTDNSSATDTDTMQVTVNPAVNQVPTANAGLDQNITLPVNAVSLNGSGTDPDGTISAYLWTKISGPAGGTITNTTSATTTVTALTQGVYRFVLRVTDNSSATDTDTMQVTVNPAVNQVPTANAGLDQNITLPVNAVSLNGSGTDPDGTISAYLWTKISGPAGGTITNTTSATTTVTALTQGVYRFVLRVTDNSSATDTDTMQVTVNPAVNQVPTANAGLDQNITLPVNTVSLNGSGTDPDGTISAYLWTKISGPAGGTITNTTSSTTTVTALTQGVYRFVLRVTDNNSATDTDTMQVTVNPAVNQVPTANAGLDQNITLPVNAVSLNGSGTDPDGTISAYLWTKISGPAGGTIANTISASTSATGMVQGIYKYELRVTDNSGATDTDTMQVTVNPAPNLAPTAEAGLNQTITLPVNAVTISGSGTDPDGTITSYSWVKLSGPANGTITNTTAATTTVTGLVQGVYQFQLTVTDNSGATDTDIMQVNVNAALPPPNQAPTANAGLNQNITLPVNQVSLIGSGNDPDGIISAYRWRKISGPATFTITNTITAATTATGLVQGVYQFELRVTDDSGANGFDTMQVTVNQAANQLPTANAGLDQSIILPVNSVSLSGSGTDPDGSISVFLWTKISGPATGTISNTTSAITSVTGLVEGVYKFELKVTDNRGGTDTDSMLVIVNPAPNQLPTAEAGLNQSITLPLNIVTLSGSGTDPDGTIAAYSWVKLSGPTSGTITNTTDATTTVTGLVQGVYQFELTVTDNEGATDTDIMQVNVNAAPPPPNQAPVADAGLDQNITLPINSVSLEGIGTDPDGTIFAYRWRKISGPTTFTITNTTTARTTVTGLVEGVYQFELRVTDNNGATGFDTMQVTVNPAVNLLPTANAGLDQTITLPVNAVSLIGSGTDPDGTISTYLWTKISGPTSGTITSATSATTSVTGLVQGIYTYQLRVTDNNGAADTDTMQVTVNPAPNQAPTAEAGLNQTITLPVNAVTLSGSGTDPDGTITSYSWVKLSGPASGTITNTTAATTTVTGLVQGVYQFQLTVTDNSGATDTDIMQVNVNAALPPPNQAPTANAGLDQNITLPVNQVSLNGTGNDPDGIISAYRWRKISGPATFTITNTTTTATTVTGLVQGVYQFEFRVTDNIGATGFDTMQVTVNQALNQAPTANAGLDQSITLPVNSVSLSGNGTDPDGTISTYLWTKISGPGTGTISSASSAITLVTGLTEAVYIFELKITDNSGATDTDTIQVTVNPALNQDPIANAGVDTSIYLPTNSLTLSGNGIDPDGNIVSYNWNVISGTSYLLTNTSSTMPTLAELQQGVYQVELTVTDNSGAIGKDTITITVGAGRLQNFIDDVTIMGNPVQNTLIAKITSTSVNRLMKIVLFSINGVLLYEKSLRQNQNVQLHEIDMTRYSKGTYILQVYFDKVTPVVKKVIKM